MGGGLTDEHVGVVELVVLCDPSSDESPCSLDSGVCTETGDLLWFTAELWLGPEVTRSKLSSEGCIGLLYKVRNQMGHPSFFFKDDGSS